MGVLNFIRNLRLGLKLNLILLLTLGGLLVVVVFVTRISLQNFTIQSGQQRVGQEVQVVQAQFAKVEQELLSDINTVSNIPGLAEAIENRDLQAIRFILVTNAARLGVTDLDIVDAAGERLVDLGDEAGLNEDQGQEDGLLALALIGSDITGTLLEEEDEGLELRLASSVPIRNTGGQIVGALLGSRPIDDELLGRMNFNRQDIQLILISQGQILARAVTEHGHEGHDNLMDLTDILLDDTVNEQALKGQVVIAENIVVSAGGSPHALVHIPLTMGGETQATIGVLAELNNLFNFQRQLVTNTSLLFGVLALVALAVVALFAARSIVRPLNKLRATAEQMAGGDYAQRAEITSADEVGQLGYAFNDMGDQIQTLVDLLEDRVAERTARLETIANLSEQLTPILDLDELLAQSVTGIQDRFGYYHAHVYLLDESQKTLVVAAGTGQAGREMKAKGHNIALNAVTSLVARAARNGELVSVENVREAPDWLPNPLLPDTYSEVAVPIILEGEVVGILDVQQDEIAALDKSDASLLRTLANQIAAGIRNAQQFKQVQETLVELEAIQDQYLQKSWDRDSLSRFTSAQANVRSTGVSTEMVSVLSTPIEFRQISIGTLELEDANPQRVWSEDELALVQAIADQVAQSAENLRLFDETRERAGREATIREITDRMRAVVNLEELVKTTAQELGQYLGVEYAFVELGLDDSVEKLDQDPNERDEPIMIS